MRQIVWVNLYDLNPKFYRNAGPRPTGTDYFNNRSMGQTEADEERWRARLDKARADWSAFEEEKSRRQNAEAGGTVKVVPIPPAQIK
jgi:hypothetical protein